MVHGGRALGRLADGQIALVRGSLPGEHVRAELELKKGVLQGRALEILKASDWRVEAPDHPGLDYGFVAYEGQLELKRQVVEDALERALRREVEVPKVRPAPEQWHYRSAIQPVVGKTGASKAGLGYRRPESHEVVVLENDPVANESLNNVWRAWKRLDVPKGVREMVLRGNDSGEVVACLIATTSARNLLDFAHRLLEIGVVGVGYAKHDARGRFRKGSERLTGKQTIRQIYGAFDVTVNATSFAQPSPAAASELYAALVELASGGKRALDLYAGSGIIGMHLLEKYERVSVLELDKSSIRRCEQDAKRLGLDLTFIHSDAKRVEIPQDIDLITVDPPRSGLNKDVRAAIDASATRQLIYVSCDVVTWARDVADFEKLGWTLESFEPFDFYPQTHHIELLSKLVRSKKQEVRS